MLNLGTTLVDEPAAATAAVITLAASSLTAHKGQKWAIGGLAWSYDAAPTAGKLNITNGGTQAFAVDVTSDGPGFIGFSDPLKGDANAELVITLASGGGAVNGIVNVLGTKLVA